MNATRPHARDRISFYLSTMAAERLIVELYCHFGTCRHRVLNTFSYLNSILKVGQQIMRFSLVS